MNKKKFSISEITKISILGTISVLLMFIKVPLPFSPTFMEMDIAELPAFCLLYTSPSPRDTR